MQLASQAKYLNQAPLIAAGLFQLLHASFDQII